MPCLIHLLKSNLLAARKDREPACSRIAQKLQGLVGWHHIKDKPAAVSLALSSPRCLTGKCSRELH